MKCPKCGGTRLQIDHAFDSYVYCKLCDTYYTKWQQAEIERLKLRLKHCATHVSAEKELTSLRARLKRIEELLTKSRFKSSLIQSNYLIEAAAKIAGEGGDAN